MTSTKFLWLALLVGALSFAACDSGEEAAGDGSGEAAEGEEAAAEGEEAAAEGEEAAAEGEEAAAEGEEAAAETQPAGNEAAANAGGDFAASAAALHGTWNADFQGMLAAQEMSEEERQLAAAMLGSASMALTFAADGTLNIAGSMMGQEQNQDGTWSEVSAAGNVLTISTTTTEEGAEPETETMTVTFASAAAITMADPSGEAIPFTRAQ